jgi:hypothetical protein
MSGFEGPIEIAFTISVKRNTGSVKEPIRDQLGAVVNDVSHSFGIVDTATGIEDVSREVCEVGLARIHDSSLGPCTGAVFITLDQEHTSALFSRSEGPDTSSESRAHYDEIPTAH